VNKINALAPIIGTENNNRVADIIFVHGLGGDYLSTWHPNGKKEADGSWLTWLGQDLEDMGIWSISYNVEPLKWRGSTMPLTDIATNLVELLDEHSIGDRPVFFITHSMGGLVVKQLLRHAHDYGNTSWKKILDKTQGIVYLSTPHSGADIACWISHIGGLIGTSISVDELKANDSRLLELNEVYRNHNVLSLIPIKVYCEANPTNNVVVVDMTSANPGVAGVTPIPLDKDHNTIAKPNSREDRPYIGVKKFIRDNLNNSSILPELENSSRPVMSLENNDYLKKKI
jgi:pimeloyl-ACP methyl ester carboxylesterase